MVRGGVALMVEVGGDVLWWMEMVVVWWLEVLAICRWWLKGMLAIWPLFVKTEGAA